MSDKNPTAADPFGQIADEFVEALRQGQRPTVEEFARRYPAHAAEIREMLPTLMLMEKAKSAADSSGQQRRDSAAAAVAPFQQLGDYRILREVGRGGMGVVYEAEQVSLGRHVALKVLPGHAHLDPRQLQRFHREARSAARLHHTNIVPVYGVGETDGQHYFVMQFIQGRGLDTVLDELKRLRRPAGSPSTHADSPPSLTRDLSAVQVALGLMSGTFARPEPAVILATAEDENVVLAELDEATETTICLPRQSESNTLSDSGRQYWQSVARVGAQVASALEHARQQGVLHRDIKPSNLLLDDTGTVWVTDFGLAKADDGDNLTHTGDIVGTLRYMAPERFNGESDVRSDVYALGLTLYELLTLRPAFEEADRNTLIRRVMHDEPARPRKLNPAVPRDLETVILKAIARDPAHRYQTPAELADDLDRFMQDRPVRARRISEIEKFWRWCRRNPALAGALGTVVLLFWVAFVGISWNYVKAEAARKDEARQRVEADNARQREADQREQSEQALYYSDIARAQLEYRANNVADAEDILDHSSQPRRGWEWRYLKQLLHADLLTLPRPGQAGHSSWAYSVAYSPDQKWIASGGGGNPFWETQGLDRRLPGEVILWNAATGARMRTFRGHKNVVVAVAFSPDGRLIASASPTDSVRIWEVATGRLLRVFPEGRTLAYSPDGKWLATGNSKGVVQLWDLAAKPAAPPVPKATFVGGIDGYVLSVAFSPDSRRLAGAFHKGGAFAGEVKVWNVPAGTEALALQSNTGFVNRVQFSPDGRYLAADQQGMGSADLVRLWDAATGQLVQSLVGHRGHISGLAFDPTGQRLASAGSDGTVRVWTVPRGQEIRIYRGHRGSVGSVAFSPDGMRLASAGIDGRLKVWDLTLDPETSDVPRRGSTYEPEALAFIGAGQQLLVAQRGGLLRRIDCDTLAEVGPVHQVGLTHRWMTPAEPAALDPSDHWFAGIIGDDPRVARCWDAQTGAERATLRGHTLPLQFVTVASNGRVATASEPPANGALRSEIKVWDGSTGRPLLELNVPEFRTERLALSPQGDRLAVSGGQLTGGSGLEPVVRVYEVATGQIVRSFAGGGAPFWALAFSPDGAHLAAASIQRMVLLWDLEAEAPTVTHEGPDQAMDLAFSPDGRRVAVASRYMVKLLDAVSGEEVLILRGFAHLNPDTDGFNPRVRFSPDGRRIAAVCHDYTNPISIWSVEEAASDPAARQQSADRRALLRHLEEAQVSLKDANRRAIFRFHLKWIAAANLTVAADLAARGSLFAQDGQWDRAMADFTRATQLAPNDEAVWYECGAGLVAAGRWQQALPYFARFADLGRGTDSQWRSITALALYRNDRDTFRRRCRKMLDLFGPSANPLLVSQLLAWGPLAGDAGVDPRTMVRQADRCLADKGLYGYRWPMLLAKGIAEYRLGRMGPALKSLLEVKSQVRGEDEDASQIVNVFFLSMTYQRLHRAPEAQAKYQQALRHIERVFGPDQYHPGKGNWADWAWCQAIRREAAALLKAKPG